MLERGCGAVFEFLLERLFVGLWELLAKPLHDGFDRTPIVVQCLVLVAGVAGIVSCVIGWFGRARGAEWSHAALTGGGVAVLTAYACMLVVGWCVRVWE